MQSKSGYPVKLSEKYPPNPGYGNDFNGENEGTEQIKLNFKIFKPQLMYLNTAIGQTVGGMIKKHGMC